MTVYYIGKVSSTRLERIAMAVDEKLDNGNDEIMLRNGMMILVYRNEDNYQVYDEELNLIAEYDNDTIGKYSMAYDMLRWSKTN